MMMIIVDDSGHSNEESWFKYQPQKTKKHTNQAKEDCAKWIGLPYQVDFHNCVLWQFSSETRL